MNARGKIVWLSSYPKSGNTWFRVFLANLLNPGMLPADINQLQQSPIASSRQIFDEATGLSASDLTREEIEELRPQVYRYLSAESENLIFQKIHDAWLKTPSGEDLIPSEATHAALYFIRNPLDVAVSFAHHSGITPEKMIFQMADEKFAFCTRPDRLHNQLEQKLLSWSGHVTSWTRNAPFPIKVMRFEDMKRDPFRLFKEAILFIGLDYTDSDIHKAIAFSDFKELKKQEAERGFREKPPRAESFFRKGETGSWKKVLSENQVRSIISVHGEVMKEFGYLDENNQPIE